MDRSSIIYKIQMAIDGDQSAIVDLYNDTYSEMYHFAYNLCRDESVTEDLLQESYITAFSKLRELRSKASFIPWLKGILINEWREYVRKDKQFGMLSLDKLPEDSGNLVSRQFSPQECTEKDETHHEIWLAVNSLPENQRICMVLFYYEEMSVDEISKVLKIPKGSVKSRLYYGRLRLKKTLGGQNISLNAFAPAPLIDKVAQGGDMIDNILAALKSTVRGSAVTTAVKAAGSGILLKLGLGFISAAAVAGIVGMMILLPHLPKPVPPVTTSTVSRSEATTASTAVTTTTAATTTTTVQTTTTTAAPKPIVSFEYQKVGGGVSLTKYTGNAAQVVIPSEIDGMKVVSIGANAFKYCRGLYSVEIPGSVAVIDDNAFRECENLSSVTMHSGLTDIGDMAFLGCSTLESVNVPSSVRSIGIYAFSYCTALENVQISEGVELLDYCAFAQCTNLRRVVLPSSLNTIGKDAFAGTPSELVLCVRDGTYAHTYALENQLNVEFII